MAQEPLTGARDQLLARLDQSFADLKAVLKRLPVLPRGEGGDWGPFEVVAHIAAWHLYSAGRLREIAAGGSGAREVDEDALNAGFVAERCAYSQQRLEDELQSSFDEMRAAAEAAPASEFWLRRSPDEEDSLAYFILAANGPEHYEEHIEALRQAAGA